MDGAGTAREPRQPVRVPEPLPRPRPTAVPSTCARTPATWPHAGARRRHTVRVPRPRPPHACAPALQPWDRKPGRASAPGTGSKTSAANEARRFFSKS